MIKYSVYLSETQLEELQQWAKNGSPVSSYIRSAIDMYLKKKRIKSITSASKKGK